jgi:protein ImuA
MSVSKAATLAQLQKQLLGLQGYKALQSHQAFHIGLGPVNQAFPGEKFPVGAIHEFITTNNTQLAASGGFIAGIMGQLMQAGGIALWIGTRRATFPVALSSFGIEPHHIIFIDTQTEKETLWATEEALKCNGIAAVVAEIKELNFTASRRLQLAVEESQVTGFLIRRHPKQLNTTACLARWQINSIHSETTDGLPGIGFPSWKVQLIKIRNGRPGSWNLSWYDNKFQFNSPVIPYQQEVQQLNVG